MTEDYPTLTDVATRLTQTMEGDMRIVFDHDAFTGIDAIDVSDQPNPADFETTIADGEGPNNSADESEEAEENTESINPREVQDNQSDVQTPQQTSGQQQPTDEQQKQAILRQKNPRVAQLEQAVFEEGEMHVIMDGHEDEVEMRKGSVGFDYESQLVHVAGEDTTYHFSFGSILSFYTPRSVFH